MSSSRDIMKEVFDSVEEMLDNDKYKEVEQVLADGYQIEEWR